MSGLSSQAIQRGIEFEPLDNGFAACEDPETLAEICSSLQAEDVQLFLDRWQGVLPSPLTPADRTRGYRHAARVPAGRDLRHPHVRLPRGRPGVV